MMPDDSGRDFLRFFLSSSYSGMVIRPIRVNNVIEHDSVLFHLFDLRLFHGLGSLSFAGAANTSPRRSMPSMIASAFARLTKASISVAAAFMSLP